MRKVKGKVHHGENLQKDVKWRSAVWRKEEFWKTFGRLSKDRKGVNGSEYEQMEANRNEKEVNGSEWKRIEENGKLPLEANRKENFLSLRSEKGTKEREIVSHLRSIRLAAKAGVRSVNL